MTHMAHLCGCWTPSPWTFKSSPDMDGILMRWEHGLADNFCQRYNLLWLVLLSKGWNASTKQ